MKKTRTLSTFFAGVFSFLVLYNTSAIALDPDRLNAQTVKITVQHAAGKEIGSGIILCRTESRIYVLTAKHVLFGEGAKDELGQSTQRFRRISTVEVEFYQNRYPTIKGNLEEFNFKRVESKDLALIWFDIQAGGNSLETAVLNPAAEVGLLQEVYTTGHPVDLQRDWFLTTGRVNQAAEYIFYSADLERGYSGGPLVNDRDELIGINTQTQRTPGGLITAQAIPINEVLNAIKRWIDPVCLQAGGKLLKVGFTSQTPGVSYNQPNPMEVPFGTRVSVTAEKDGYKSKTITADIREDNTVIDFKSLEPLSYEVRFRSETPDVTYDHPNPSLIPYDGGITVTASKSGYQSKTVKRDGVSGNTVIDFGALVPERVAVTFVSKTKNVAFSHPNPSLQAPGTQLTVTASKPGYLSKTRRVHVGTQQTTVDFGELELTPISVDLDPIPFRTIRGLIPMWILDLHGFGISIDSFSFTEQTGNFRFVPDPGNSIVRNESGERLTPYLEFVGRVLPSEPDHTYGRIVLRPPEDAAERERFEKQYRMPSAQFDIKKENGRGNRGTIQFGGGWWSDSRSQINLGGLNVDFTNLLLSIEGLSGNANIRFEGISITDRYNQLKVKPLNFVITTVGEGSNARNVAIHLDGADFTKYGPAKSPKDAQPLWRLDNVAISIDTRPRDGIKSFAHIEIGLEDLRVHSTGQPGKDFAFECQAVLDMKMPARERIGSLFKLMLMLVRTEIQQGEDRFFTKVLREQLARRSLAALSEGLALDLTQASFSVDGNPGSANGRIYWEGDFNSLSAERIGEGNLELLLPVTYVDLKVELTESFVLDWTAANDKQLHDLFTRLIRHRWIGVDNRGRLSFDLSVRNGVILIGGRDIARLPP